jgi:hypothetical protein
VAEQPTGVVELVDGQLRAADELLTDRGARSGQGGDDTDADLVGGAGPAGGQESRGGEQAGDDAGAPPPAPVTEAERAVQAAASPRSAR